MGSRGRFKENEVGKKRKGIIVCSGVK